MSAQGPQEKARWFELAPIPSLHLGDPPQSSLLHCDKEGTGPWELEVMMQCRLFMNLEHCWVFIIFPVIEQLPPFDSPGL